MVQTSDHIFICIYAYTCTFNWTSRVLNNAHYKFSSCFTRHKSDTQHVFSLIQSHTTSSNTLRFNRPTLWLHSCLALSQTKIVQNQFVYVNCSPDFTILKYIPFACQSSSWGRDFPCSFGMFFFRNQAWFVLGKFWFLCFLCSKLKYIVFWGWFLLNNSKKLNYPSLRGIFKGGYTLPIWWLVLVLIGTIESPNIGLEYKGKQFLALLLLRSGMSTQVFSKIGTFWYSSCFSSCDG